MFQQPRGMYEIVPVSYLKRGLGSNPWCFHLFFGPAGVLVFKSQLIPSLAFVKPEPALKAWALGSLETCSEESKELWLYARLKDSRSLGLAQAS